MSLKWKYEGIEKTHDFRGTYRELKEIVGARLGVGVWKDFGKIRRFELANVGLELNWNHKTGGILFVHNLDRDWRKKKFPKPDKHARAVATRDWITIERGCHKGMSLPEVFLNSPLECFEHYIGAEGTLGKALDRDAAEIWERIGRIKIPNHCERRAASAHYFDAHEDYRGFRIVGVSHRFSRARPGYIVVQDHIDLQQPWLALASDDGIERIAGCLLRAVGKDRLGRLDRESCERFFNDQNNFVSRLSKSRSI